MEFGFFGGSGVEAGSGDELQENDTAYLGAEFDLRFAVLGFGSHIGGYGMAAEAGA